MLTVATVNVNGVRAAVRRGMGAWLAQREPDVLCLQEVRADDAVLRSLLAEVGGEGWHVAHAEPADPGTRGRAGVAVATRLPVGGQRDAAAAGLGPRWAGAGRWVELDVAVPGLAAPLTVVSTYVPTGGAGTPRQDEKQAFLDAATARTRQLAGGAGEALVTGDLNIAPTDADVRNWRGNRGKAGCLPEERAHLEGWAAAGWVDVVRALHPGEEGPYSWWSWRGQAFDRDTGWRIDHQFATPGLAALAADARVDRAASYPERFSDHAPVVLRYGGPGSPPGAVG